MSVTALTAADGASWESVLLGGLGSGPSRLSIGRRCVDVVELVAVAASGQAQVAMVDAQLRGLDADVVERLLAAGVAVVGIAETDSVADAQRLAEAGISFMAPTNAPVAALLTVLESAIEELAGTGPYAGGYADPAQASLAGRRPSDGVPIKPAEPPRRGSVVAVWGPTGAPGRTLVAVNLADELSRLGMQALLIDADVYGGVAANMFGLLDDSPGLVAACRQAQGRRLDAMGLAGLCWQISGSLRVLTGIGRADRWPEVRPAALEAVLEVGRGLVDYTVLDLGFGLETDEELSYDTAAPRRNGATLAALAAADLVLVVGGADPIGMQRLIRGLDELGTIQLQNQSWIVLNRVRGSVLGGSAMRRASALGVAGGASTGRGAARPGSADRAELQDALQRFAGRTATAVLPLDLAATDRALAEGKTLAEAAPSSALRLAIRELAGSICGVPAPSLGRRRR